MSLSATPADPRLPKCPRQRNEDPLDASIPNGGDPDAETLQIEADSFFQNLFTNDHVVHEIQNCGNLSYFYYPLKLLSFMAWSCKRLVLVHNFILWSIGDGSLVRFWHDLWLPRLGRLIDWKLPTASIDDNLLVQDVLTADGDWN
ncbi:hypothetical protein V6N12_030313 [Hibiscus sabdariffa]|uniref:Uncharacterized protein n=1 Tax=Hibiscus sabdariffa TaxID=183260 RepID=A0ABR2C169_9ROSI